MNPSKEQIARAEKVVTQLPPDVLQHPMPFPSRLDYSAKIVAQALADEAEAVRREGEKDTERLQLLEDWLMKQDYTFELRKFGSKTFWVGGDTTGEGPSATTFREAIDAYATTRPTGDTK